MPIYEYRCERGHDFEVMQRMTDDPLTSCSTCGSSLQRVFRPVAVHFKGSGFYATDYGKKKAAAASSGSDSAGKPDSAGKSDPKHDGGSKGSSGSESATSSSSSAGD